MKKILRILAVAAAFSLAVATSSFPAHALAPKDATLECDLQGLLDQLAQFTDDSATSSMDAELALRKQILARSMECNAREAAALAGTVSSLDGLSVISSSLKGRYAHALKDAAAYANGQGDRIDAVANVSSSKDLARELRDWRANTYNPIAWEASQVIVLDRNLGLAASAQDRLKALQESVAKLPDGDATTAIDDELAEADGLIRDGDQKLNDALTLLRDNPKTAQEQITSTQKAGLDGLSRAYKLLLDSNAKIAEVPAPPAQ